MSEIYKTQSITDLFHIMNKLLSPQGCPWDREQTPQTLAPYAIEEAHELAEALESKNNNSIKEELGDFLFQVVFHCALAERTGDFKFEDVIETICTKLIRRHPHVFADVKVENSDEVLKNWTKIKDAEKKNTEKKDPFQIPVNLPALQRAQKIGDKTKSLKFDWDSASAVLVKVDEEMRELKEALQNHDKKHIEEELGDVFFVLSQLARHLKLEAESVARRANQKFEKRFARMLKLAENKGVEFSKMSAEEKEDLWNETKKLLTQ